MIGVIAVQGGFEAHRSLLARRGVATRAVVRSTELEGCDGLILPGGESTAQRRLLDEGTLATAIASWIEAGRPVLGTCAGLVLLVERFRAIGAELERNGWGRQAESFEAELANGAGPALFIRAPRIRATSKQARIVRSLGTGEPVALLQGSCLGAAFHPELSEDWDLYQQAFPFLAPMGSIS